MKYENGVSMIALVITIIVILIISGIGIGVGSQVINSTYKQSVKTNMLLIESKAKLSEEQVVFRTSNKTNETEIEQIKSQEYVGTKLSDVIDTNVIAQINNLISNNTLPNPSENEQEFVKYYYLNQENLNSMGLNEIKESDGNYYFVKYDEESVEVIFTGGYKDLSGNTYYTLSQLK